MKRLSEIRQQAAATPTVNALVAAATLVSRDSLTSALRRPTRKTAAEWQEIAWEHYETCGELRFACEWLGNSLSRIRLFAARITDKDAAPEPLADDDPASLAMEALCGGQDGQSEMLKRFGPHLTVPGESYLVGWDDPKTGRQEWATLCGDEIQETTVGDRVEITWMGEKKELPADALIIRFWRPHPRRHWEANSPVRGLELILNELLKLTMHVQAQADSRLAGAGVFVLPLETTFPKPPSSDLEMSSDENPQQAANDGLEGFMRTLTEAMVRPIVNRDDASAVVPVVIQAPGDQIKNVRHITFATPLAQEAMLLRQEAIRRLAAGLDMPSEILTGLGQSNHWTAWQIDEGSVKTHIEPIVQLICNALSVCYLRPIMGEDVNDSDLVVGYDASELKQRPDRSAIAKDLYELGELSGDALRREAGFGDADAPTAKDDRRAVLRGMLDRAAIDTATAVELAVLMGYVQEGDLSAAPAEGKEIGQGDEADPTDAQDPRALPSGEDDPPPEENAARSAAAKAQAPAATMARALENGAEGLKTFARARRLAESLVGQHVMDYAGKRLLSRAGRSHRGKHPDVPMSLLHTVIPVKYEDLDMLLDGAFTAFPELEVSVRGEVERAARAALLGGIPYENRYLPEPPRG